MLRLTGLDSDGMTDDTRDAFVNMAENLGIDLGEAEDLVDQYLDEADKMGDPGFHPGEAARRGRRALSVAKAPAAEVAAPAVSVEPQVAIVTERLPSFVNSTGAQMMFVPSGAFVMGSDAVDAGPNERPVTKVTLSRFYMCRFPVTNAEYEQFDPCARAETRARSGRSAPVVYVTSLEAIKYCQWIGRVNGRSTVCRPKRSGSTPPAARTAESIRGAILIDGAISRITPTRTPSLRGAIGRSATAIQRVRRWALSARCQPLRDRRHGGNVWEWCLDFFEQYRGTPKGESARRDVRREALLPWRQLEIALQQRAHDRPRVERPELFL
jgi:hypothetical protein